MSRYSANHHWGGLASSPSDERNISHSARLRKLNRLRKKQQRLEIESVVRRAEREIVRQVQSSAAGGSGPSSNLYSVFDETFPNEVPDVRINPNLKAVEALGLTLIILSKPTPLGPLVLDQIGQIAKRRQYQGEWMVVHHILKVFDVRLALYLLFEEYRKTPRDVFGNIIPMGLKALNQKVKVVDPYRQGPVRRPQRKRGYDDKGSSRPAHRWLPTDVHVGPNPDKLELDSMYSVRRRLVNFLFA